MPFEFDIEAMRAELAGLERGRNTGKLEFPPEAVALLIEAWDSGAKKSEVIKWWRKFGFSGSEDTLRRVVREAKEAQ